MPVDYTAAAAVALEKAEQWAAFVGAVEVRPDHLLQGLLWEEEGRPSLLLAQAGADPSKVRDPRLGVLSSRPDTPVRRTAVSAPLSLGEATRRILRHAADLGPQLSADGSVASDQVLLALLREDAAVRQRLVALGLDFASFE